MLGFKLMLLHLVGKYMSTKPIIERAWAADAVLFVQFYNWRSASPRTVWAFDPAPHECVAGKLGGTPSMFRLVSQTEMVNLMELVPVAFVEQLELQEVEV